MTANGSMTNMPPGVVSRKVYGAVGAGTIGAVTSDLVIGLLDDHYYDPTTPGSVPVYITGFIVVVFQVAFTLAGGYFTKRGWDEVDTPGTDDTMPPMPDTRPVRRVDYGDETGDGA